MLKDEFPDDASDWGYHHARTKARNQDLKAKYDEMHKQGSTSWFGDGREERELILKMGEPWEWKMVVEIGCGEGDLVAMMAEAGARLVYGIDYSEEAIHKALKKYPRAHLRIGNYREPQLGFWPENLDVLVMQGVLEHLDDPFGELQWMIEHFKPKTVITSSPCFLNPRGIVWMTLDMLGAVMSKTDLHFLHPWQFEEFCDRHDYSLQYQSCDISWGNGTGMIDDLKQRIPLALKDGNLPQKSLEKLLSFLERNCWTDLGATMVYRIDIP